MAKGTEVTFSLCGVEEMTEEKRPEMTPEEASKTYHSHNFGDSKYQKHEKDFYRSTKDSKVDIHTLRIMYETGCGIEEVTPELRAVGKKCNFYRMYSGPRKVVFSTD